MSTQPSRFLAVLVAATAALAVEAAPRGNGKIAFDSSRSGNVDIFVMEADGASPVRLTTHLGQDRAPAFSPDGTRIAFHSTRNGNADIFVMNADGTGAVQLTASSDNELQPAWSPDGARLAYARMNPTTGTHDLWVVRSDGTGAANLGAHPANDIRPSWAPDGSAIVFQSDRDGNTEVYLVPMGGSGASGPAVNLTNHPAEDTDPVFTADGSQVVFVSNRTTLTTRLFRMYTDGTLQTQLAGSLDFDKDPAMAPDGTSVLFAGMRGTSTDEIWTLDLEEGSAARLTVNSFADRSPDWQGLQLEEENHPPLANAGADGTVPCADAQGAMVTLDGSASSDPDSTTGTNDDVAVFEWFAAFGTPDEHLLGTGMQLQVVLAPGTTEVTLRVTDAEGLQDTDTATWTVVDPQAPTLEVTADPGVLWPPNHRMVDVHLTVNASGGLCSPAPDFVLQSVESSEAGQSNGRRGRRNGNGLSHAAAFVDGAALGTADLDLQLRAERYSMAGRVYTLTYAITSGAGAGTTAFTEVVVPHDQRTVPGPPPNSDAGLQAGEVSLRIR